MSIESIIGWAVVIVASGIGWYLSHRKGQRQLAESFGRLSAEVEMMKSALNNGIISEVRDLMITQATLIETCENIKALLASHIEDNSQVARVSKRMKKLEKLLREHVGEKNEPSSSLEHAEGYPKNF